MLKTRKLLRLGIAFSNFVFSLERFKVGNNTEQDIKFLITKSQATSRSQFVLSNLSFFVYSANYLLPALS